MYCMDSVLVFLCFESDSCARRALLLRIPRPLLVSDEVANIYESYVVKREGKRNRVGAYV